MFSITRTDLHKYSYPFRYLLHDSSIGVSVLFRRVSSYIKSILLIPSAYWHISSLGISQRAWGFLLHDISLATNGMENISVDTGVSSLLRLERSGITLTFFALTFLSLYLTLSFRDRRTQTQFLSIVSALKRLWYLRDFLQPLLPKSSRVKTENKHTMLLKSFRFTGSQQKWSHSFRNLGTGKH